LPSEQLVDDAPGRVVQSIPSPVEEQPPQEVASCCTFKHSNPPDEVSEDPDRMGQADKPVGHCELLVALGDTLLRAAALGVAGSAHFELPCALLSPLEVPLGARLLRATPLAVAAPVQLRSEAVSKYQLYISEKGRKKERNVRNMYA
jgi:hypothetical protein